MPKGRARGTLDKVEAVSRNMGGPQGQPEPEDEDLDWLEQQGNRFVALQRKTTLT